MTKTKKNALQIIATMSEEEFNAFLGRVLRAREKALKRKPAAIKVKFPKWKGNRFN